MAIFSPNLPSILSTLSFSFLFSSIIPSLHHHHLLLRSFLGFSGGLGLVTAIALVIVRKPPHHVHTDAPRHHIGGLVAEGLASCTKSLGSECSDESGLMDQLQNRPAEDSFLKGKAADTGAEIRRRTSHCGRKEVRSFPPPLSSLNLNGQPSFFLRPVRKDGRLKLTEVRIHRPQILFACRHDGRLKLHLVAEENNLDDLEDDGEAKLEEEEQEQEEEIVKAVRDEEEEFRFGDWKFGNKGLKRCQQELNDLGGHNHHRLQLRMPGVGIA